MSPEAPAGAPVPFSVPGGSLFAGVPAAAVPDELVAVLAAAGPVRVERIVSTGQASPDGFWYDQESEEFVLLVAGAAGLRMEGEAEARVLGPGDWVRIPAHTRHRVDWTDSDRPTVWLAVHYPPGPSHE